jgi:hypothetical protein
MVPWAASGSLVSPFCEEMPKRTAGSTEDGSPANR